MGLIFASILGNYLYFSSVLYNKILENNRWALWQELKDPGDRDLGTEIAIEASCFLSNAQFWLFRAIWLFPYVFRSVRLRLIWGMQREYLVSDDDAAVAELDTSMQSRQRYMPSSAGSMMSSNHSRKSQSIFKAKSLEETNEMIKGVSKRSTYWIQEKNLLKWLFVALSPLALCIIGALASKYFSIMLPSMSMYQCGNWEKVFDDKPVDAYHKSLNISVGFYLNLEFILCTIFFGTVFWLRNIHDEFNINKEIRRMSIALYITDTLYVASLLFLYDTVFVVLGFVQYIQVACCLFLLYLTGFHKILQSYKPNEILPFPLTQESIESLDSALLMPTSCQTFYEFLNDLGDA